MSKPLIVGINGSPHKGKSHTRKLLKLVTDEANRRAVNTKIIDLAELKILPHTGKFNPNKYLDNQEDDMAELTKNLLQADGLVFASPTHWFNMSSLMKIFIDRLTSLEDYGFLLEGKIGGFIAYGPQGGAFNNVSLMSTIANQMGLIIPPYGMIFDEGRKDGWVIKDCKLLAKNMIELIKIGKNSKWGENTDNYKKSPIEMTKK